MWVMGRYHPIIERLLALFTLGYAFDCTLIGRGIKYLLTFLGTILFLHCCFDLLSFFSKGHLVSPLRYPGLLYMGVSSYVSPTGVKGVQQIVGNPQGNGSPEVGVVIGVPL